MIRFRPAIIAALLAAPAAAVHAVGTLAYDPAGQVSSNIQSALNGSASQGTDGGTGSVQELAGIDTIPWMTGRGDWELKSFSSHPLNRRNADTALLSRSFEGSRRSSANSVHNLQTTFFAPLLKRC